MADKSYKSYRQQLNILRSRGMVIGKSSQGSRVMRILERENYYNVVNGYKELFLASKASATADEVYKTGTTFDEVYALYNFDRELRNIYLKYLLKLENTFKTVIAHEFSAHTIDCLRLLALGSSHSSYCSLVCSFSNRCSLSQ